MNGTGNTESISAEAVPPVHYQLISPEGYRLGVYYASAREAASAAGGFWPGVGQKDDDRAGWDVEAVR